MRQVICLRRAWSTGSTQVLNLHINGVDQRVHADEDEPLLFVLRGELGLNGAKYGCGAGQCGACTVLRDGKPIRSCLTPASQMVGHEITTLEGLSSGDTLHPVQQAFWDERAGQCVYCIPGMIMAVTALLRELPDPSERDVRQALDGHLCRCGSHNRIVKAALRAAHGA